MLGFLLLCVFIVFITPNRVYATEVNDLGIFDSDDTGSRTVISPPGSAEDADDLRELNIANNLTVTYQDGEGNLSGTLRILITLTLIALAPTIVIMMTSFTRILIVMHFVRSALGTQTAPPNQVLVGLSLSLTHFIMNPEITQINNDAYATGIY